MSYPSNTRMPPGMAGVPAGAVPGMTGMTAVQAAGMPGIARMPGGLYQAEKQAAGLYPTPQVYQGLSPAQQSYLAQVSSATGQPGYFASAQPGGSPYLPASSPASQQRYMVSPAYPGASVVSSASLLTGAPGYSLTAGTPGYTLTAQPAGAACTTLSSQVQAGYPTYINSQFGPMQISPSQSPYATAAGHPLYPTSPYASLQVQQATQVQQGQVPAQLAGRVPAGYSAATTGLPLGYPYTY